MAGSWVHALPTSVSRRRKPAKRLNIFPRIVAPLENPPGHSSFPAWGNPSAPLQPPPAQRRIWPVSGSQDSP